MKRIRQLLTLLLLAIGANAGAVEIDGINYIFNSSNHTAKVIAGFYFGDIDIPSSVSYNGNSFDVVSIEEKAFNGCINLTSVSMANSITTIGEKAFTGCTSLLSVGLSNSITSIESSTFKNCTSLTSIVIPNSITNIGNSAFEGCASLANIVIPNSVSSIGYNAFADCI